MGLNKLKICVTFLSILSTMMFLCSLGYAKPSTSESANKVLAKAGKYYISEENCNQDGYNCNYVLHGTQKPKILLKEWSHTANAYQFTPQLMGFLFGATGSGALLTLIDDQNRQRDFADVKAINARKTCMVTFESDIKNMPASLVFYSIPDFKVRLVLNKKVPQFKKFNALSNANFEDNGDFRFEYTYQIENELGIQNVIVQNPCTANYRIVTD